MSRVPGRPARRRPAIGKGGWDVQDAAVSGATFPAERPTSLLDDVPFKPITQRSETWPDSKRGGPSREAVVQTRSTRVEMEFEMRARLNRIKLRDLALFVVVAGVVAVAGVFIGGEAGLGDRGAGAQGEPLILTLTPEADHCVTKGSREAWGIGSDGARQTSGWVVVAEAAVRWYVAGGEPPYTLKINGKSADADGQSFSGASGRATVGCANTSASWRWGEWSSQPARYYASDPALDSGWLTIEAEVRDSSGTEAEATVRIYTVFTAVNDLDLLRGGETYSVFGHFITIPEGVDMRIGDSSTGSSSGFQSFYIEGSDPYVVIWLKADTFQEVRSQPAFRRGNRSQRSVLATQRTSCKSFTQP